MRRSSITHAVALLAGLIGCLLGLWAILAAGAGLKAPPHIGGRWVLIALDGGGLGAGEMRIEQSGRFVRLSLDGGPFVDHRLELPEDGAPGVDLHGPSGTLRLRPPGTGAGSQPASGAGPGPAWEIEGLQLGDEPPRRFRAQPSPEQSAATTASESSARVHPFILLLGQLAVIVVASRAMGLLAARLRQPRVIGEMVAGLLLGPSLLGWLLPGTFASLFPAWSIPTLGLLAELGVVFFLFIVGLELNPQLLRNRGSTAATISHASIVLPLLLGAAIALPLYPEVFHAAPEMRFSSVALFMGAAMSITAFPVLARILIERNLQRSQVGALAITCAAIGDVTAWCVLAFVVAMARSAGLADAALTTLLAAVYVVAMILVVRPGLRWIEAFHDRRGQLTPGILALLVLVVLCSSLATAAIGIHALFGAFMAGAILPKGTRFVREVSQRVEPFTLVVLLPIFFAFTGLKTRIDLIDSPQLLLMAVGVVAVACVGKFGGAALAARACGLPWRESSAIGILMNTRGLMELVILDMGRQLGVISDAVFAMMVLMALVTTVLTTPILDLVLPDRLLRGRAAQPTPVAPGRRHASILVPISMPASAPGLASMADLISGPAAVGRQIVGLHLRSGEEHEVYEAAADAARDGQDTEVEARLEVPGLAGSDAAGAARSAPLQALQASAAALGMPIELDARVGADPSAEIVRTAEDRRAGLILMGFHKPIIGTTILGGPVHRVLEDARCDVAILVDRGLPERPRSILVPYLGSDDDRLALEIASTISRSCGAGTTVLHVVPPGRESEGGGETPPRQRLHAKVVTERVFSDPSQPGSVTFKVIESGDPIAVALQHSAAYDLLLVGATEQWGLASQRFGWRAEPLARESGTSLLVVKRGPAG